MVAGLFPLTKKKSNSILQAASSIRITTVMAAIFLFLSSFSCNYVIRCGRSSWEPRTE